MNSCFWRSLCYKYLCHRTIYIYISTRCTTLCTLRKLITCLLLKQGHYCAIKKLNQQYSDVNFLARKHTQRGHQHHLSLAFCWLKQKWRLSEGSHWKFLKIWWKWTICNTATGAAMSCMAVVAAAIDLPLPMRSAIVLLLCQDVADGSLLNDTINSLMSPQYSFDCQ